METATFWVAVVAYAASTILVTGGLIFRRERFVDIGHYVALTGFAAQTLSILARLAATGRLPYVQDYETALACIERSVASLAELDRLYQDEIAKVEASNSQTLTLLEGALECTDLGAGNNGAGVLGQSPPPPGPEWATEPAVTWNRITRLRGYEL